MAEDISEFLVEIKGNRLWLRLRLRLRWVCRPGQYLGLSGSGYYR